MYLNGSLPDGKLGGLSSKDIDQFGAACERYGGSKSIIKALRNKQNEEPLKVVIVNDENPRKCKVSLYKTGVSLDEIMKEFVSPTVITPDEQKKVVDEHDERDSKTQITDEKQPLPKIDSKKPIILQECDFSKNNLITGKLLYEGQWYNGVIFNITPKQKKALKGKSSITTKYKGNDGVRYILILN